MTTLLLLITLVVPNLSLTPGIARPLTAVQVCSIAWGTDTRHVTSQMREWVFISYGVPRSEYGRYVIDHLIPRELAGADVIENLWPQPIMDARNKDREENRLHRAVCAHKVSLVAAQQQMREWGR